VALCISVAAFLLASAVAVAVGVDRDGDTATTAAAPGPGPVEVSLTEFAIRPAAISGARSLIVTNDGAMAHDLVVVGTDVATPVLQPGESYTLDLAGLAPGTYTMICTIAGHEASGMTGTLTVGEGGTGGEQAGHAGHGHAGHGHVGAGMSPEEAAAKDQRMLDSILAFPAETEGRGNQVLEPAEILPDGTKRFELTAEIVEWEVAPGQMVEAWTYNGMVPGPMFVLDVGDRIQVDLQNNLPLMTDIHWHGIMLPNDQDGVAPITQEPVMPGESFSYRFTLTRPAVALYHPHAHAEIKMPKGMAGAMIVGDVPVPEGRTIGDMTIPPDIEISQRLPMVLNDAGVIGLSLNGKSFPATEPIVARQGDWIAIDYFGKGLMLHPMHLHGMDQLVVAKDGHALEHPYLVDTLNIAPGERYTVLVHATELGKWAFHCHILTHVKGPEGMFGMVTVLIVEPPA
jgi:FtsP/CotA-like multicopper oxidase with cupredoxin domain